MPRSPKETALLSFAIRLAVIALFVFAVPVTPSFAQASGPWTSIASPSMPLRMSMKPPPYTPEKFVKSTWFARPLRANILPHWSAPVAHAPVSSNAFSSCSDSKTEPAMIAVARTRLRSTIIGFFP